MDSLFTPKPVSTNLSGANPLSAPSGSIPGSGLLGWLGGLFSTPAGSGQSLTGGASAKPLLPTAPSSANIPGIAGQLGAGFPGLPVLNAATTPTTPTSQASYAPQASMVPQTPAKVTQPVAPAFPVAGAAPSTSPTGQASAMSFSTGTTGSSPTIDSNYMSPGALQDLLDARKAKEQALMQGGTKGNGLVGSDSLIGNIASQLYQSSLYTPQEQQLIANQLDMQNQVNYDTLQAKRNIASMQENGQISKEQGASMIQDTQDRANARLADLNYNANSAAAQLQAFGTIRQNQVTALGSYLNALQPQSVAPGSTLYNPITGVNYQGAGASPQAIASYGQQLAQSAVQQGTAQYTADGSVDYNYYNQVASQLLSPGGSTTGGAAGGTGAGGPSSVGGTNFPQPGTPEFAQALPATVYPAYRSTANGKSYFDSSKLDSAGIGAARVIAKATGVPILDASAAQDVQTVDQAMKNLSTLKANFDSLAHQNVSGSIFSNFVDPISGILQTSYGQALNTYNSNRSALLQQVRALAGSSPRLSSPELQLEQSALPTLSFLSKDTQSQGDTKINTVMGYLNNALGSIIPSSGGQSGAASGNTLGTGSSIVQTKAGAIDTNW